MAKSIWEMDFKDHVSAGVAQMKSAVGSAFSDMSSAEHGFESDMQHAGGSIGELKESLMGMAEAAGVAFAVDKIKEWGMEILHATAEFEGFQNIIKFASSTEEEGAKNLDYIGEAITRLHLPMKQAYEQFSELQGGLLGTGVEGEKLRGIFEGMAEASSVLHLDADKFSRAGLAIKEIGELGQVQSRQMRQLAMALPGSMTVAAHAMHMSMEQFHEAMKDGLSAKDFLPKFGEALKERFGSGLANAGNSLVARMNDTTTAWFRLQVELGEKLKPVYIGIMDGLISVTSMAGKALGNTVDYIGEHFKDIQDDIAGMGGEMGGSLSKVFASLKQFIKPLDDSIHSIWKGLRQFFNEIPNMLDMLGPTFKMLGESFIFFIEAYGKYVGWLWSVIAGIVDVSHTIFVFLDKIGAIAVVEDVFSGILQFIGWIGEKIMWLYDNTLKPIFDAIGWVYDKIKDLLGIHDHKFSAKMEIHGAGGEWTEKSNKGYNAAAGGEDSSKEKSKSESARRSVIVTIHKIVGIEHVHVGRLEDAGPIAGRHMTNGMIGAVQDFETGIAADS